MERTSWPFSVLKPAGAHERLSIDTQNPPLQICLITTTTSCSAFLLLACSDYDGFHQFARVEAGLDHLSAAEQGVSLVLLCIVALRCLLACTGQTGLGNWDALSWRRKQDGVLVVMTKSCIRCVLEGKFLSVGGATGEHNLSACSHSRCRSPGRAQRRRASPSHWLERR